MCHDRCKLNDPTEGNTEHIRATEGALRARGWRLTTAYDGGPGCGVVELHMHGIPAMVECIDEEGTLNVENVQMGSNDLKRGHTDITNSLGKANPGIEKRMLTRDRWNLWEKVNFTERKTNSELKPLRD